jgi:hypothetical protein
MPRVTEIIQNFILSPGYFDNADPTKGAFLHQAIAWWLNGELDETSLDEKLRPQFNQFVAFWQEHKPGLIFVEKHMVHPAGFEGTPDLFVTFKVLGKLEYSIVDIKTGGQEPWHAIQLAAYQALVYENYKEMGWPKCYNLYLRQNGYSLKSYSPVDIFSGWKVFQAGLEIYNWRKSLKD